MVGQLLPSWSFSEYPTAKRSFGKQHPFQHAALVTKDEVRGFQRPAPEVRTGLATTMWLRAALKEMPISHPNYPSTMALLDREPQTPSMTSYSTTSRRSSQTSSKKAVLFGTLPPEVRSLIYSYAAEDCEPISPTTEESDTKAFSTVSSYIKTGLPILHQVFPQLHEVVTMLPKYYTSQVFQFDLRDELGLPSLWRWIDQRSDEVSSARTISLHYYTWYYSSSDCCWSYIADVTVFTLTSSGHIRLKKASAQLDPDSCICAIADLIAAQFPEWKEKEQWSLMDFIVALRQERDPLIDAVAKFIDVLHQHEERFQKFKASRKPCTVCGKHMVFLRTSNELNYTVS
ncbi:hypothetical protein DOTSEDRAFT_68831 [Dothistroma septosporum NZE10]|uniref:F-box domain-containing protein n=1 Tax=Dothistroma septosporum (strain NZE10 / CBS 128990) TaxID=675120 RepID=N1Q4A1_DOTSN|nr:hypothetical protein DOTSEDRAFT_68831 [Dothistroma septosporum NZE10]